MTCDECRLYLETKPPQLCSRAERAAIQSHMIDCPACMAHCIAIREAIYERATPETRQRWEREEDDEIREDARDAEYRKMVFGA